MPFYSLRVGEVDAPTAADDGIWRTTGGTSFNNTGSLVVGGTLSLATFVAFEVPDPVPDVRWGVSSAAITFTSSATGPSVDQNATITIIDPDVAVPTAHAEAVAMTSLAPSVAWTITSTTAGDTTVTPDLSDLIEAWHDSAGVLTTATRYLFKIMWGTNAASTAASFESYDTSEPDAPALEMFVTEPAVSLFGGNWG